MSIASSDYYIAGWWPKNEVLANKVMAISGELLGQPLFVYAGNPTNRQHPVHFFRWVTNAIFGSKLATLKDYVPPKNPDRVGVPIHNQTLVQAVNYQASPAVQKKSKSRTSPRNRRKLICTLRSFKLLASRKRMLPPLEKERSWISSRCRLR